MPLLRERPFSLRRALDQIDAEQRRTLALLRANRRARPDQAGRTRAVPQSEDSAEGKAGVYQGDR